MNMRVTRKDVDDYWKHEVLSELGVKPDRKTRKPRSPKRTRQLSQEYAGPLNDTAPPPPSLTHARCQGGPECSHTPTRWECHCDGIEPAADPVRTCIMTAEGNERSDGSIDALRCQTCDLCAWEKEAERWDHVRILRPEVSLERPKDRPAFPSLDAAIIAFIEWERHDRWGPSAMGPLIDRLKGGAHATQQGTTYKPDREDPLLRRAGDVLPVRAAIHAAYPQRNDWSLSPVTCAVMLVAATGGVLERRPSWQAFQDVFGVPRATVKAIVRHGQRFVGVELAARGLIPMPARSLGWHEDIERRRGEMAREGSG